MIRDSVQQIIDNVSAWEGITASPHRFGGVEFTLGKVEIGHIHHGGLVDIPYPKKLRDALVADGEAEPHHVLPESGWTSYHMRGDADVQNALQLFRLSYLQKRSRRDRTLEHSQYHENVKMLGFSERVLDALLIPLNNA